MKKIILVVVLTIFTFLNSFSQKESKGFKGVWWGLAAFNYSNDEATDTQSFLILPAVGTFVSPTVTVGGAIGYLSSKTGEADASGIFIVKPLVRKYWGMSDKFFLFAEANVPLLFHEDFNGYGFNIEPGVDYFIGGKWTIEAKFGKFGYNATKGTADGAEAVGNTTFGFNMFDNQTQHGLNSGMSLGLKYIF